MKRTLIVGESDEGFDYQDAAEKLQFVLDTLDHFGGAFSVVAARDEVAPGEFVLRRLIFQYDSFAPARRTYEVEELEEAAA